MLKENMEEAMRKKMDKAFLEDETQFHLKSKEMWQITSRHSEAYIKAVKKNMNVKSSNRNEIIMGR